MRHIIKVLLIVALTMTLVSCNFSEEKEFDVNNPTRVAFLGLDIIDILDEVGFEKTNIKEMGMISKGNVSYLDKYNNDVDIIDLGSHRELDYTKLDLLDPELIILSSRTSSLKTELSSKYPKAKIYDATHNISKGALVDTIGKNIEFLKVTFPSLSNDLDSHYNNIVNDIESLSAKNSGSKALVIVLSGDETRSYGKNSRFGMIYKEFGFEIVSDELDSEDSHGAILSYETIKEYDPQVIFVMDRTKAIGQDTNVDFNAFTNNKLVESTKAGINNDIYELDGSAWYMVAGGFQSANQMILDISAYFNN